MSFIEPAFLYFLPIFICGWLIARRNYWAQIGFMLAGSLVFYAHNRWWTLSLIATYCLVDWLVGIRIEKSPRPRLLLLAGIFFNLVVLAYWKYMPLIAKGFVALFDIEIVSTSRLESWTTPIGVSFYAFMGIAYMVDVYNGTVKPERNLLRYSLFTSFFPHLVAGPILRAQEFLVHLRPEHIPKKPLDIWEGAFLIARGVFKKMVLADTIAAAIDPYFINITAAPTQGIWSLPFIYLYSFQIYFDFSGYTDIARGLGLWFGFRWPENFNWPYAATSIQDFWRRWHMTLSRFLRDYLYLPLGGSKGGRFRTSLNLMITMMLGGLWHGASLSFALWGAIHGALLVVHRIWHDSVLRSRLSGALGPVVMTMLGIFVTFNSVSLSWCYFRLTDFAASNACVEKSFAFDIPIAGGSADRSLWALLAIYGVAAASAKLCMRSSPVGQFSKLLETRPFMRGIAWGATVGLVVLAIMIAPITERPAFIYFQF